MTARLNGPALRDYQRTAIDTARTALTSAGRVTIALPCGTGKTLVGQHIAHHSGSRTVLFTPTIALTEQTIRAWRTVQPNLLTIAVHSGPTDADDDTPDSLTADLVTTDPDQLRDALTRSSTGPSRHLLVACTYASAPRIAEAVAGTDLPPFDLRILDEAHRTVGVPARAWSVALDNTHIPARAQLALTATPKTITVPTTTDEPVTVVDMADAGTYGEVLLPLTYREAITAGYLADYRIVIVAVTDARAAEVLRQPRNTTLTVADNALDPAWIPGQLALLDVMRTQPAASALVFTNRIAHSQAYTATMNGLTALLPAEQLPTGTASTWHVDGGTPADLRDSATAAIDAAAPGKSWTVLSNCRVFAEGIDVPSLDAVVFAEPRTSAVDIVQSVGRALRRNPDNPAKIATIVLPVLITDDMLHTANPRLALSAFRHITHTLAALGEQDPALFDVLNQIRETPPGTPTPPQDRLQIITTIDDPDVATWWATAFRHHVVDRLTRTETELAPAVADYSRRHGHTRIPVAHTDRWGRPLGRWVAQLRGQHHDGVLTQHVVDTMEEIPNWSWQLHSQTAAARRREILECATSSIETNGTIAVLRYAHRRLNDGHEIHLGGWLKQQADRYRTMDAATKEEFDTALGSGWQRLTRTWPAT